MNLVFTNIFTNIVKVLLMFGSALYTFGFMLFCMFACIYGGWHIIPDALLPYESFILIPLLFNFQVVLLYTFIRDFKRSIRRDKIIKEYHIKKKE